MEKKKTMCGEVIRYQQALDDIEYLWEKEEMIDSELIYTMQRCINALGKYRRALESACDMLETFDMAHSEHLSRKPQNAKEWKEWAMKDEG